MSARILLIEDEPGLIVALSDLLAGAGYRVAIAADGEAGVAAADATNFDLIVLDVMLPKRTGFEVCRELRLRGTDVPVLMLTARTEVADRVQGLKTGADDYLCKPFDPAELLARVEALLRRPRKAEPPGREVRFGTVVIDFGQAQVWKNGDRLNMAAKELKLLQYLVEHRNLLVTREEVLRNVWNYSGGVSSRTIDVHIAWLRQKLEDNPAEPRHIHTIRGQGYRFTA